MKESKDYLEITYMSIDVFKDGKCDRDELEKLLSIALKDGVVDDNEKRVLTNIFSRLTKEELTADVTVRIDEIKKKYSIQ